MHSREEKTCAHTRKLYRDADNSIIHCGQKVETTDIHLVNGSTKYSLLQSIVLRRAEATVDVLSHWFLWSLWTDFRHVNQSSRHVFIRRDGKRGYSEGREGGLLREEKNDMPPSALQFYLGSQGSFQRTLSILLLTFDWQQDCVRLLSPQHTCSYLMEGRFYYYSDMLKVQGVTLAHVELVLIRSCS